MQNSTTHSTVTSIRYNTCTDIHAFFLTCNQLTLTAIFRLGYPAIQSFLKALEGYIFTPEAFNDTSGK